MSKKVESEVQLTIYDVSGQKIKTIFRGVLRPGTYYFSWAGETDNHARVASGVYLAVLSMVHQHQIQK
jgi:23S rRNA maturation-related 3'-5' exoribonuclease YhaM